MIFTFKIFRFDPQKDAEPYEQEFSLDLGDAAEKITVLDALFKIQQTQDKTLSFRYSCRLAMCGSCALVINGQEGLACKTLIRNLGPGLISLKPLSHLPIIKDLTVDLKSLINRLKKVEPFFIPRTTSPEPAKIKPTSRERRTIGLNTECIACGSCVSACTMMHWDPEYIGPMGLNRAFCLIADSRDSAGMRLEKIADENGVYRCHMEFNCTDVCPKHLSPTRGIHYLKRQIFWQEMKSLNPFRRGRSK
jgi:succinate dehydrogenase/fumarate reductase iron-sulfur protein